MTEQGILIGKAAFPGSAADPVYFPGTELLRGVGRGAGSAAGAENQHFFTGQIQADAADEPGQTVQVRVITGQFPVPADNGVDRADGTGGFIDFIQKGNDSLLVGNGDIDSPELPRRHEGGQLLRRQFLQFIGIAADFPVDFPGKTVRQVLADAAVF